MKDNWSISVGTSVFFLPDSQCCYLGTISGWGNFSGKGDFYILLQNPVFLFSKREVPKTVLHGQGLAQWRCELQYVGEMKILWRAWAEDWWSYLSDTGATHYIQSGSLLYKYSISRRKNVLVLFSPAPPRWTFWSTAVSPGPVFLVRLLTLEFKYIFVCVFR